MAVEAEIAAHSIDVLSEVFEFGSTISTVSSIIKFSGSLASAIPVVGAFLVLIGDFLPGRHQEILRGLMELSGKIDLVRNDMKEMEKIIRWEITELRYGDAVDRIELGLEYFLEIGNISEANETMRFQDRLKELCANENCALALKALMGGVNGKNGVLGGSTILDKLYNKTQGNRPRILAFSTRLLQLIIGGMFVEITYERMMRGKEGAEEIAEFFSLPLNETCEKVQSVLDRCEENFRENMLNDLKQKLDEGGSNENLVYEISTLMSAKYDWLENYCIVYNLYGHKHDRHFGGNLIESLDRNGKSGIVFYRTKSEPHKYSDRYEEAYQIVAWARTKDAERYFTNIVAKLNERGIGWTGCAIYRPTHNGHFRWNGTFSTKIVYSYTYRFTSSRWMNAYLVDSNAILLLN